MRAWRPRSGPNSHQIDFLFDVQNFPRLHEASVARPDPSITFYLRRDWGCGRGRPVVRGQYCLRLGPASKTWLMVHTNSPYIFPINLHAVGAGVRVRVGLSQMYFNHPALVVGSVSRFDDLALTPCVATYRRCQRFPSRVAHPRF